jgi:tetratricopeptide (TPR) repeat protein
VKNVKYIILGLLLASSTAITAHAKDPSIPELEISDDSSLDEKSLDPLLEVSAPGETAKTADQNAIAAPNALLSGNTAETGEKKKILDKAIKEVFEEPKKDEAAAPAKVEEKAAEKAPEATSEFDSVEVTATGSAEKPKSTEAPKIDEAADPLSIDNSVEDLELPEDMKEPDTKPADAKSAEKAIEIKPVEKTAVKDEAVKPIESAVPALPVTEPVTITPKKEEKAEVKPAEKTEIKKEIKVKEKATVAPDKFKLAKPKAKVKKKLALPKATPKSLREDYLQPRASVAPVYNNIVPITPVATPVNFPAGTKPIQDIGAPQNTVPIVPTTSSNPAKKAPASLKQSSIEKDELDAIQEFPSKKKALAVKSDINIDRGGFADPFIGKGNSPQTAADEPIDALAEASYTKEDNAAADNGSSEAPVVDFSDTSEDINALQGSNPASKPQSFYMQDAGLEMEVKDAPKNSVNVMKNAYEALQVGQYESAIKYYNEALEQNPNNKKALFGVATAYHMSKDYEKAKEAYLKIINMDPNYWPAVNNYIILVTEENPEKSIGRLEELYTRNPDFAAIPAQLGNLYYKKGNAQKAVEYYVSAVRLDPKNVEYRYNLALILEKTSRKEDAAQLYRSLLDDAAQGTKLPENPITIKDRYDQLISKQS